LLVNPSPGSGNSWFLGDGSGNITLTFDVNNYADGWHGTWGRMGTSTDPGTCTAVGNWQGWNNTGNSMTALGGGVYRYQQGRAPGLYLWKAVVTGAWHASGDDFRGVNANTTWFEVTADNPFAAFEVNALAGIERVYTVPEPSTLALLGCGLAAGFCWLHRRR
jgi:hypothetical protein